MPGAVPKLHLPFAQRPLADRRLWQDAAQNDDPFGDAAGVRLAKMASLAAQDGELLLSRQRRSATGAVGGLRWSCTTMARC
jgi:hypothetical protein